MITRFAPSPTGLLHLGHAYSAILAHDMARAEGGTFLLRIEDIDQGRSRPEWEELIYEDLAWLGLSWEVPVMRQSERMAAYAAALAALDQAGLLYACTCNRRDIAEAARAPQDGEPAYGPDGVVYPGTCRGKNRDRTGAALRLDMAEALRQTVVSAGQFEVAVEDRLQQGLPTLFRETGSGPNGETGAIGTSDVQMIEGIGDVVLARRDMGTSYHLSVVVDDAAQGATHVVRGQDLFEATKIHVVLQRLLGLPVPIYHHHRLIRDDQGKRLAKRDDARAIRTYREAGASPADIRRMVGL